MQQVSTSTHTFVLTGEGDRFSSIMTCSHIADGLALIGIKINAALKEIPPVFALEWTHPISDIQASWHPAADRNKSYKADWMRNLKSNAAASAPVLSLFNSNGRNRLTFAFSDALNTVEYFAGVHEEGAVFNCGIKLFTEVTAPLDAYEAYLLVDTREIAYYDSLNDVQEWWSGMPEYRPARVPEAAKTPMYSTWYSMHQNMTAQHVEEQCAIAKALGMDAVIVDDGWQTSDNRRGYAYCGDWDVYEGKFPDFANHVNSIHKLGMKFILWYSVPYVGKFSRAWDQFKDRFIDYNERIGAGILDPRYPEVREYIISTYENAVLRWNLDGFKLDFIDRFYMPEVEGDQNREGKDIDSLPAAVDRLLTDIIARLRELKPDIMIEFRQPYIGPAMRKYGNMFRAGDCPNDSIQNRTRTIDIRLIGGSTATHADMIMWNPQEPVESAALQLIGLLFSVPQVSVLLDQIPIEHQRMLRHWLSVWKQNRDVLLEGRIMPMNPELLYPVVEARKENKSIIVSYHDAMISIDAGIEVTQYIVVNGRLKEDIYLNLEQSMGEAKVEMTDCCGNVTGRFSCDFYAGIHKLPIPPAGLAAIKFKQKGE
ncbi:glycoside hydrolase family 36 protein [Paenibacillus agaridevorans]|nr:glycoside hydrolase family 36 protein [Paenibacillus agaridevorans]